MAQPQRIEIEQDIFPEIRMKSTERECPRCDAMLEHNDNEQCYECLNCGYIDCGDEEETIKYAKRV
jgi:ribosomal protein S27AE